MTHQALPPSSSPERELLRSKGQFWTPAWLARVMVRYALKNGSQTLFDPAVGAGAFFLAAKEEGKRTQRHIHLSGYEIEASALAEGLDHGLCDEDLKDVAIEDFLTSEAAEPLMAVVANPPYVRHHRISLEAKSRLRQIAQHYIGHTIDGRAGLHVFFLIACLGRLAPGGRLAFVLPADTFEGVFAPVLWAWATRHFRVDGILRFTPEATPFPSVDTNAVVVFIEKAQPRQEMSWAISASKSSEVLSTWIDSDGDVSSNSELITGRTPVDQAILHGLSRLGMSNSHEKWTLGHFATVMRGIATGANDFFFLDRRTMEEHGLPSTFFRRAVGRTRDIQSERFTLDDLNKLDAKGRPTYLLSLDGSALDRLPDMVSSYLAQGEALGLPQKALIQQRKPWYRMEQRTTPPILFAYLGRRNARFIRNDAEVLPLTGFLCVFPKTRESRSVEALFKILNAPETIENLRLVGKSYGSGAIKVEPRALERLPLPESLVVASGLLNELQHQPMLLPA